MISTLKLSLRSMWNRKTASLLSIFSIALSVSLLLSIDRVRHGVKNSFEQTLSGMDLIVGPRGGSLQVLLYSVFHIGMPNNNVSKATYEEIRKHPEVEWTIPISMGDSHRGFPVVATDQNLFKHFKVAKKHLEFSEGRPFEKIFEAVIGSEIAKKLNYKLGQKLILSHGMGEASFHDHDDTPVYVVGILKQTGSPADQTIHVDMSSLDAMHADHMHDHDHSHEHHNHSYDHSHSHAHDHEHHHESSSMSAFLVGLKHKQAILSIQRMINDYEKEPIMAIVPGLTFMELWSLMSTADVALLLVSIFVIFAGVLGMLSSLLSTLENRRREIAVLRAVGARPFDIFILFLSESLFLGIAAYILGFLIVFPLFYLMQPLLVEKFGFHMPLSFYWSYDLSLAAAVLVLAFVAGVIPAWKAYRRSLTDGLTVRI